MNGESPLPHIAANQCVHACVVVVVDGVRFSRARLLDFQRANNGDDDDDDVVFLETHL